MSGRRRRSSWRGGVSVELAFCLVRCSPPPGAGGRCPPRRVRALAAVWIVLVIGRYADVTAPALFGRHDQSVLGSPLHARRRRHGARVAALALVFACVAGAAIVLAAIYLLMRRSFDRIRVAMTRPGERRVSPCSAIAALVMFGVDRLRGTDPARRYFRRRSR